MLKQFNSNARKLNRIVPKINPNNLVSTDLTGSLLNIEIPTNTKFNSNVRKLNRIVPKINPNNLVSTDLTGSLLNIEIPTNTKFESKTRSNPNPTQFVNNKGKINDFYQEILQNSARYVSRNVDIFDNILNTLTIYNVSLDYGTEGANPDNFELLVFGLHIPGDFTVKEVGNDVVVTLNDEYIDFDSVTLNDIYVIGKLVDIPIATEDNFIITTEDGLDIII